MPINERKYVQAIEFRPGNGKVVHHARILLDETGELRQRDLDEPGPGFDGMDAPGAHFPDGHFLGWAPGKMPRREDVAWPLGRREPISIVQAHMKPTGRQEMFKASIGIYFTNKPPASIRSCCASARRPSTFRQVSKYVVTTRTRSRSRPRLSASTRTPTTSDAR